MWSVDVEVRGLYCSLVKENNLEKTSSLCQDICEYLPMKYPFIRKSVGGGVRNIDSLAKHETPSEKLTRLIKLDRKPKVIFDKNEVRAIAIEPLYAFLQESNKSRVIGISNTWIHDGEKFFGGFWSVSGKEIVESMPYWENSLQIHHRLSDENLRILISKSCIHEIAESYGCKHHATPRGCVMDIHLNAFARPEALCNDCITILNRLGSM